MILIHKETYNLECFRSYFVIRYWEISKL